MPNEVAGEAGPFSQAGEDSIVLWIRADSSVPTVAGAIVKNHDEGKKVSARAVGAGAVNQTIKGFAVAGQIMLDREVPVLLALAPCFETIKIDGEDRTSMNMVAIPLDPSVLG